MTGQEPEPAAKALTILVVEDARQVREVARRILQSGGYQVLTVENAPEALTLLAENPNVDLLVTDVVMPQMSGPQLVEKARALRPHLSVLYMSGYPQDLLERGEVDEKISLLEKPFRAAELLRRVSDVLGAVPKG